MTAATLHPLAADYLKRFKREARSLPRARQRELMAEIEEHLDAAIEPDATDAEVLTVLDRLGEPEDIVAAEQPDTVVNARGGQEWAAIFFLLFGGFAVGIGWLAGVVLLWSSNAWTVREKLVGTLVIPGGLGAVPFWLLVFSTGCGTTSSGRNSCTSDGTALPTQILGWLLLAAILLAPIATAIFLARRAGRTRPV